jgi:hypothetical protein
MAYLSADELRTKFTAFAEAAGVEELGKPAFISLVQAIMVQVCLCGTGDIRSRTLDR